jgi:hypothetical protein
MTTVHTETAADEPHLADAVQDLLVPGVVAMAEVEARDVHAWQNHGKTLSAQRSCLPGTAQRLPQTQMQGLADLATTIWILRISEHLLSLLK